MYIHIHRHRHTLKCTHVYTHTYTHTDTPRESKVAFYFTYFQVNKDTVLFYHPIWLSYENIF